MELFLDILAIRVDSRKAEGLRFTMNLQTPDNGEQFIVELNNSTLTHIKGIQLQIPLPHACDQPLRSEVGDDWHYHLVRVDCSNSAR